ncbi:glycosyltransferase family 4 protein [Pseudomonadota bacterium]
MRNRERTLIAFFGHPDVFEDFYPHYHVDQRSFATKWANTGSHEFLRLIEREVGDVIWYEFSLDPELNEARHEYVGCIIRFFSSSWLHRKLWRLFYLPKSAWRWRSAYRTYSLFASYLAPLSWRFLWKIWRERPDIIFVQDYSTGRFDVLQILARAMGSRFVAYHAGSKPETYVGSLLRRWTLPRADMLILSSQSEFEMLASRFHVPRNKLQTVLTPIDIAVFRPRDRSKACQLAGLLVSRRYLLFVGRLDDRVKRVSALIHVFGKLSERFSDVDLIIIGDGPDVEALTTLKETLPVGRCEFLGWLASKELLSVYYNVAECLILPSISEGFPTVVGEAIACGTPVVGSAVGGVSELVIPGKTGWLFPPGDDDALQDALTEVLEHPEILKNMRSNARVIAEQRVAPAAVAVQLRECLTGKSDK